MTVIAWDGKTLACDRQSTIGEKIATRTKLLRLPGVICATCGDTDSGLELKEWVRNGMDPKAWPSFQSTDSWVILVIATKDGVFEFNQRPFPIPCEDQFMAWGQGHAYATGAMAAGKDAVEAVRIASRFCTTCGMGVDYVNVKDELERGTNGSR
jgi:hypothetical protein